MQEGWTPWILIYIGSFGPPVSAAVVTWLRGDDVRAWARQIIRWRVGWPWWVAVFGIPIAIIGVVWAGLHLPYFLIPITPHSGFTFVNQIGWFVGIILLSVILAWVYNGTGGVLIVMVLHAMANTADILLPLAPDLIVVDRVIDEAAVGTVVMVPVGGPVTRCDRSRCVLRPRLARSWSDS